MITLPKTQKSLWQGSYTSSLYPALEGKISADVAIVGAGISGLTSAYLLKQAGLTVVVLDKASVGGGTTGRTTGKVTSQHNLIYASLQRHVGAEAAKQYGQLNEAAIGQTEEIIKRENIDCDWRREDNYVFTADPKQVSDFQRESAVARSFGLPASFETKSPLPFPIEGAVKFKNQATYNAEKYLLGLAAAVDGNGSHVFEHSKVTRIHDGEPGSVKTKAGTVQAKHIIVATNVPTLPLAARGTYCMYEHPNESYIVAGKLPKKQPGMYISPDKHHFSILPVVFGGEDYLLVGGKSHLSGLRGSVDARYQELARYAHDNFGVTEFTHTWSDRDYSAYDDLPLIGKMYPWSKHLYVISAFNKWGLTNGMVAAQLLRGEVTGKPHPAAQYFTPNRLRATAAFGRAARKHLPF